MGREKLEIPEYLRRGDVSKRYLVDSNLQKSIEITNNDILLQEECLFSDFIHTNMINGGNPNDIYKPLEQLLVKHIDKGWPKTHFLSTTDKLKIARKYALHFDDADKANEYFDNYLYKCSPSKGDDWKYLIAKICLKNVDFKETENSGVYLGCYYNNEIHSMLLINVIKAISEHNSEAYKKAKEDKEWLILPLDQIEVGISAKFKLPKGSILEYFE